MSGAKGSKQLILDYFLAHLGQVIESQTLQEVSGWKSEWGRRVRELRDEDGWPVLSHKDRADLKPGQYILESLQRRPAFKRGISKETKACVLERGRAHLPNVRPGGGRSRSVHPGPRGAADHGPHPRQVQRRR